MKSFTSKGRGHFKYLAVLFHRIQSVSAFFASYGFGISVGQAQGFSGNLNPFMAWWSESMMIAPGLVRKQKKEAHGAGGLGLVGGRDWKVGRNWWEGLEGGREGAGNA